MDQIRRFEYWLKAGRFIPLVILLVLLNLAVYFLWKRHIVVNSPQTVNIAVIDGLRQEKNRIQSILDGSCESPETKTMKKLRIVTQNHKMSSLVY